MTLFLFLALPLGFLLPKQLLVKNDFKYRRIVYIKVVYGGMLMLVVLMPGNKEEKKREERKREKKREKRDFSIKKLPSQFFMI
jgi:hypothetical protein